MSTTQKQFDGKADSVAHAMGYRLGSITQGTTYWLTLVPHEGNEEVMPERSIMLAKSRAESFRMLVAIDSALLIERANEGRRRKRDKTQ